MESQQGGRREGCSQVTRFLCDCEFFDEGEGIAAIGPQKFLPQKPCDFATRWLVITILLETFEEIACGLTVDGNVRDRQSQRLAICGAL